MHCSNDIQDCDDYSITLSARTSNIGDMSMPRALAVFRLITNSILVGCMTGRSAGLVPLRMRPAYYEEWVRADQDGTDSLIDDGRQDGIEFPLCAGAEHNKLTSHLLRRSFDVLQLRIHVGTVWIHERTDHGC